MSDRIRTKYNKLKVMGEDTTPFLEDFIEEAELNCSVEELREMLEKPTLGRVIMESILNDRASDVKDIVHSEIIERGTLLVEAYKHDLSQMIYETENLDEGNYRLRLGSKPERMMGPIKGSGRSASEPSSEDRIPQSKSDEELLKAQKKRNGKFRGMPPPYYAKVDYDKY